MLVVLIKRKLMNSLSRFLPIFYLHSRIHMVYALCIKLDLQYMNFTQAFHCMIQSLSPFYGCVVFPCINIHLLANGHLGQFQFGEMVG